MCEGPEQDNAEVALEVKASQVGLAWAGMGGKQRVRDVIIARVRCRRDRVQPSNLKRKLQFRGLDTVPRFATATFSQILLPVGSGDAAIVRDVHLS